MSKAVAFPFGKYKGQRVEEVAQSSEGESYCKWLINQDFCPSEIYDYCVYVLGL